MTLLDNGEVERALNEVTAAGNPPQPYARILRAYLRGAGVRLTADEVHKLCAQDDVIVRVILTASEELGGER